MREFPRISMEGGLVQLDEGSVATLEKPRPVAAPIPTIRILSARVAALTFRQQVGLLTQWARDRDRGRAVCVANVHMLIEAERNPSFSRVLRGADLVTPDGMPLVWLMRRAGSARQERVAGMDMLPVLCATAERAAVGVYFLGSTPEVLTAIRARIARDYPRLLVAGMESPPFREMTADEEAQVARRITASGAGFVFVSLGCPKQEQWIHRNRPRIPAVLIGLGAAFPVFAGLQRRAPIRLQRMGLEWLYRLAREPHRLWWRYLSTNTMFLLLLARSRGRIAPRTPMRHPVIAKREAESSG